jgi:protease-4
MESEDTVAVMLRINSPGGSPVQSDLVYQEILRLRAQYPEKPVYAVIGDIGASGAYYIAAAAEKIYASPSSIVGSIGVTSGGSFGFVDALEKLGVERRVYTSGENKAFLDPFLPEKPADKARYEAMLKNVHQQFIRAVENERAERITDSEAIFNGYVWTGEESLELGLIDAYGSIRTIAREEFDGLEEFVDYTPQQDFFSRFADRIGASAAKTLVEILAPAPSFK